MKHALVRAHSSISVDMWLERKEDAPMMPLQFQGVAAFWVAQAMNLVSPSMPHEVAINQGEISTAIASAATQDPLFEGELGGYKTAALLVALARHESGFRKDILGDHGRSVGLYQIQPPTARVNLHLLTLPRDASFVAIDLIRQSFHACRTLPIWDRLAWYAQGKTACTSTAPSAQALSASRQIMHEATWILLKMAPPSPKTESEFAATVVKR